MEGILETKEAIVGINELSIELVKVFKDGFQSTDVLELVAVLQSNQGLKDALQKAISGASKIPSEIKDINLSEGLELAVVQLSYLPKLQEAFKK